MEERRFRLKGMFRGRMDGREVNGRSCGMDANRNRVDRIRLLGNGVLPQCVVKAFLTLTEKLTERLKYG